DLANGLGNLVSRSLKMVESFCEGVVPRRAGESAAEIALHATADRAIQAHDAAAAQLHFADALAAIFSLVDAANKHYQVTQPWQLAKDPANAAPVAAALYAGLEALRLVAHLLWPYMPTTADAICGQLGGPSRSSVRSPRTSTSSPSARSAWTCPAVARRVRCRSARSQPSSTWRPSSTSRSWCTSETPAPRFGASSPVIPPAASSIATAR